MRRPVLASSSPRSIRSQSGSTLERRAHPHRTVPRASERGRPHLPLLGKERAIRRAQQEPERRVLRSFPPSGTDRDGSELGTKLRIVAAEACGAGFRANGDGPRRWCACPRRTLFATEWSAARRKRSTAAVLHLGAAISADVKAVRFRRAAARKGNGDRPQFPASRANGVRPRCAKLVSAAKADEV